MFGWDKFQWPLSGLIGAAKPVLVIICTALYSDCLTILILQHGSLLPHSQVKHWVGLVLQNVAQLLSAVQTPVLSARLRDIRLCLTATWAKSVLLLFLVKLHSPPLISRIMNYLQILEIYRDNNAVAYSEGFRSDENWFLVRLFTRFIRYLAQTNFEFC